MNFTITKDRLEQIVELCRNSSFEAYDETRMASLTEACSTESVENMALALLAGMKSKPVAFIDKSWSLVYYQPPMNFGLKIGDNLYRQEQPVRDSCAIADVIAERQRQQSVKGFSAEQDDTYVGFQLSAAAICYIEPMEAENYWPADWYEDSFKPTDTRRNLIKAAALIIAEIERIDRKPDVELKNE
ncbi:hypothetical protein KC248_20435 [Klebsiella michiganensis]|uniref:hypothetical protein n=1 Tax=Klebsiella michiganensis TaxID=1134687 RepID=UPI001B8235F3|nr:hypothetical protein [Klebsiella michiganensis]MBR7533445.1 hypothetical protein [Klebsiella michiganensis]MBR7573098.1 hypothetical protein [Klebsiella michiganensis]